MAIDSLDAHDGYPPAKGHIGVAILPAMLAIADLNPKKYTGQEFLTLLALGYELGSRMAAVQHANTSDYHASGSWNGVAAAAILSRMLHLTPEEAREAMGIAEYHGPRSQMMRCIAHPTMVEDSSGWGAMTGVSSAYLAQSGFTGAPAIIIDSEGIGEFWSDLGGAWKITEQYFKPYPICRWAHGQIAAAEFLQQEHNINHKDISDIEIVTFYEACCLNHPNPKNTEEAQYSLPFPVAAMLVKGEVSAAEVTTELNNIDILCLANKIRMTERVLTDQRYPGQRISKVIITLYDGSCYESDNTPPYGSPEFPLTQDQLITKFHNLSDPLIGCEQANNVKGEVFKLAQGGSIKQLLETIMQRSRFSG